MSLSERSNEFLGNVRIYLISSGKNEQEVDEIVGELEDHLWEGEKHGKSVEELIGQTPKQYMDSLSKEMALDYKGIFQYIVVVMLGALSFIVLGDALSGDMDYSLLELIGYPVVITAFLFLTSIVFKYISSGSVSKKKEWISFFLLGLFPVTVLSGILLLNGYIETPQISFGETARITALILTILVLIGISIWSKSWIMIIIAVIFYVPQTIFQHTSWDEKTQAIVSSAIFPVGMAGYFVYTLIKLKKVEKQSKPVT